MLNKVMNQPTSRQSQVAIDVAKASKVHPGQACSGFFSAFFIYHSIDYVLLITNIISQDVKTLSSLRYLQNAERV